MKLVTIVIGGIVILSCFVFGILFLVTDLFPSFSGISRNIFAIILLCYGIFRLFRLRKKIMEYKQYGENRK